MKKSGLADSPFFKEPPQSDDLSPIPLEKIPQSDKEPEQAGKPKASQTPETRKSLETTAEDESKLASLQANKQVSKQTSKQKSLQTSLQESMQSLLSEKATKPATFRYPLDLLEKLEDVLHVARKEYRRKLTKNEIAVAALLFLLLDFEAYGQESVLYQLLIKQPE
jgi:hypothetical protein